MLYRFAILGIWARLYAALPFSHVYGSCSSALSIREGLGVRIHHDAGVSNAK
jgi:hypothetical protein